MKRFAVNVMVSEASDSDMYTPCLVHESSILVKLPLEHFDVSDEQLAEFAKRLNIALTDFAKREYHQATVELEVENPRTVF